MGGVQFRIFDVVPCASGIIERWKVENEETVQDCVKNVSKI